MPQLQYIADRRQIKVDKLDRQTFRRTVDGLYESYMNTLRYSPCWLS